MNNLTGVVMCGGKSERMGSDKGLLRKGTLTWAEFAFHKLSSLCTHTVVSVNETQYKNYSEILPKDQLLTDQKTLDLRGPLAGLLSVHKQYPSSDLLVLACDLPAIESEVLNELIKLYQEKKADFDFIVFSIEGEMEPLVGIYNAAGLSKIVELYQGGRLQKHSMKYALEHSRTYVQEVQEEYWPAFKNFNTKDSLDS